MPTKTIALWGDTQVGKTTLLAVALCSQYHGFNLIDMAASNAELGRTLLPVWNLLQLGMPTPPTSSSKIDTKLTCRDDMEIQLRDIRGAIASGKNHDEKLKIVNGADGIIFVLEWNAANMAAQFNAITSIVSIFNDKPKGLVFTKCEKNFDDTDDVWSAPLGWWKMESPELERHAPLLCQFGDAVWPTSSWGYDEDGTPCAILGEFGQLIPYRINPRGVYAPFVWMFKRLGLIS